MRLNKRITASIQFLLSVIAMSCWVLSAQAQSTSAAPLSRAVSLKDVFDTAWSRQPEARALQLRRDAAQSQAKAAGLLSPEPPSLEVSQRSDRTADNNGVRQAEVGIAVPIWLPGQRSASLDLAQAEISFVERKLLASQLRLASSVREAWWNWLRARVDAELAREQLTNAQRLAADVAKRTNAGDLAKSDQHQAEGVAAAAEALAAQADAASASEFASSAAAQYFFNAGGLIKIDVSKSSTGATGDPEWNDLANTLCGDIYISGLATAHTIAGTSYTGTTKIGGTGSPSTLSTGTGWDALSAGAAATIVYKQFADTAPYTSNFIQHSIAKNAGSTTLTITTLWSNGDSDPITGRTAASGATPGTAPCTIVTYFPPETTTLTNTWGTPTVAATTS